MNAFTKITAALGLREAPGTLTRRAPAAVRPIPSTWHPESRTFQAVLATGTAVERQDTRGVFDEVLAIEGATLPERVPLLDSHARDSVDRVIGHVAGLQVVNGELVGTVTLSRHNAQAVRLAAEISDGHSFGVSIGYAVGTWADRTNPQSKRRERVATAWTLLEASLVPVPADASAGMRGTPAMPAATAPATPPPAAGSRAAVNAEIRALAATAGLTREWADAQVDGEATADQARAAAFEAMRTRTAPGSTVSAIHVVTTHDDPQARVRAMGEALFTRITPTHRPSDQARAYVGLSMVDLARETLRIAGVSTTGLSGAAVIERAMIGLHTVSDFSQVLGDTVGRVLRASYTAAPSPLRQLARQVTAVDFRSRASVRLIGNLGLERVNEAGEFKAGTISEGGESYRVETFGKTFGITRQAIVNDSLGAFASIPAMLGAAAANFEAKFLAELVSSNPLMADGRAVFHVDHGNLAATPAPITLASLAAARLAMRRQTDESGEIIGVNPRYLVVSPERETEALQVVATIAAATPAEVNTFTGALSIIVEPRLPAGAWYMVADPAIAGLEYAYLEGEQPQVISEAGFSIDGVRHRVRLDFGGGWIDHRAWFRNAGA